MGLIGNKMKRQNQFTIRSNNDTFRITGTMT